MSGRAQLAAVVQAHYDAVWRFCLSRTASPEQAEDAVHDTFVRFMEKAPDGHPNPEAWLIRAAGWACSDLRRRERLRAATGLCDDAALGCVPSVEDTTVDAAVVRDLLRDLRPADADLLRAVYLHGESVAAVARARGLAEGSVRMMLMRARRRAREALGAVGAGLTALPLTHVLRRLRALRADDVALRIGVEATAAVALVVSLVLLPATAARRLPVDAAAASPTPSHHVAATTVAQLGQSAGVPAMTAPARALSRADTSRTAVAPAATLPPILDPGANATSHNGRFDFIVPSPAYTTDGTVFAMGRQQQDCTACLAVLFVTRDFGVTWQDLHADSLGYGPVLVSPAYAVDHTVFVLDASGLQQSTDGGVSFGPTPVRTPATLGAIASSPLGAGSRVAFIPATGGPWQVLYYDAGSSNLGAGPVLPPDLQPTSIAFGQDGNDVLVGGKGQLSGGSEVAVCRIGDTTCATVTLPSATPAMDTWVRVVGVQPVGSASTVFAYTPWAAYVSADSGMSFQPLAVPVGAGLAELDPSPGFAGNRTILVTSMAGGSNAADILTEGTVTGSAFSQLSQATVPGALDSDALLAGGDIVASRYSTTDPTLLGLACSADSGVTWQASC